MNSKIIIITNENITRPDATELKSTKKSEINHVVKVMREAKTLTQGPYLKKFEENFSKFIGSKYCFAVNSATSALELSAQLCQLKKGDEVIVPESAPENARRPERTPKKARRQEAAPGEGEEHHLDAQHL